MMQILYLFQPVMLSEGFLSPEQIALISMVVVLFAVMANIL